MATNDALLQFTHDALAHGASRQDLDDALTRAGWQRSQVRAVLGAYADVSFPVPVPAPRRSVSAKEAFQYLLLFATLYLVAYHAGSVAFLWIDRLFPDSAVDAVRRGFNPVSAMRWSVASLVVATPVFLWISAIARRDRRRDPAAQFGAVRRWLTYLTLFVAALVLIGDATVLLYTWLNGEMTLRFVLKAATLAAIGAIVFAYYLRDVRIDEQTAAT
jgi:hypothetical protein